jgi:hypothetical protein
LFWDKAHPNTLCDPLSVMSSSNNSFR